MIQRFLIFLGPARARALFLLIAATGLLSLILNAVSDAGEWVAVVQSGLAAAALIGSVIIIAGRMEPEERGRILAIMVPAVGAILLGLTLLPQFLWLLVGAAVGWVIVGLFIFRSRAPDGLKRAIKHLRKNEYAEAVKELDTLIKEDPDNPNHYRFRGEVLRVWGKLDRARRDYVKMTQLDPESAVAYNGLSEVLLQVGDYRAAREAALKASSLAPNDWGGLYNLGMVEDRLGDADGVIQHLEAALALNVRDARHRALIHFYLVRAYTRKANAEAARNALTGLKRHRLGLEEWERILSSDQAETLKAVLGQDITLAQQLANGEIAPDALLAQEARR